MFRFAHPELLYLLIVIPLLIVFYVVMIRRKKKAIAEFGNPELLGPLMPLLSFKRGTWKFVMLMLALYGYCTGTGDGYRECDRSGRPVVYTGNRDVQSDYCHHGRRKPSG